MEAKAPQRLSALRLVGWFFLALLCLGAIGLFLLDDLPKNDSTEWLEGPGANRIRGATWTKSHNWDESVVHQYTEVAPDGSETVIGEGLVNLRAGMAKLYENTDQAELVVSGSVFRRDHAGGWSEFQAEDASFVYRHYAQGVPEQFGDSWYYSAVGIHCKIVDLNQIKQQLVSACNFPVSVTLVFQRASYAEPWVLDQIATFAKTPPPQRANFPDAVRGTLTTIRIVPADSAAQLLAASRLLEQAIRAKGTRQVAQVEFELAGTEATDLSINAEGYEVHWRLRGGWLDSAHRPVIFWSEHPLQQEKEFTRHWGQPWTQPTLVDNRLRHQEDARYLTYLELRPQ